MGFGKTYSASNEELLNRMLETGMWEIPFEKRGGDNRVNIVQVATCLAKKVVQEHQGEDFKPLEESHPLTKKLRSSVRDLTLTVGNIFMKEAEKNYTAKKVTKALLSPKRAPDKKPEVLSTPETEPPPPKADTGGEEKKEGGAETSDM